MKTESAVGTLHNFRDFNLLVPNIWILRKNVLKCLVLSGIGLLLRAGVWMLFSVAWCLVSTERLVGAGTSHKHSHFIPANIGFS